MPSACSMSIKDTQVDAKVLNAIERCHSVQMGPLSFSRMKAGSSLAPIWSETCDS